MHNCSNSTMPLEINEAVQLIEKLQVFTIRGRDKRRRKILRIVGKYFPAAVVSVESVKKYLEDEVFPELEDQPFSIVYLHADVEKSDNFPGISALRSIYDSIPIKVRDNLQAVYFVHPGFQARLFLATVGRFFFAGGLYGKLRYISRLDYLWEQVKRKEMEIPEFVYDRDEELEYRPMMDYGIESDHPRVSCAPHDDSPVETYSTRCIS